MRLWFCLALVLCFLLTEAAAQTSITEPSRDFVYLPKDSEDPVLYFSALGYPSLGEYGEYRPTGEDMLSYSFRPQHLSRKRVGDTLKIWHKEGNLFLSFSEDSISGVKELRTYYPKTGQLRRYERYVNGSREKIECYNAAGAKINSAPFFTPPNPGKYFNKEQYFPRRLRHPAKLKRKGIKGVVLVSFRVDPLGRLTYVKVLKGLHPELDKQTVDVVNGMQDWVAGSVEGAGLTPIDMVMPIRFDSSLMVKKRRSIAVGLIFSAVFAVIAYIIIIE